MTQALIFGHSHVWSVRRALSAGWSHPAVTASAPICGTKELPGPIVYGTGKDARLNPVVVAALYRIIGTPAQDDTWLVSMAQGNFYNSVGMLAQDRCFDFVLASHPALPVTPGATLLPSSALREVLAQPMDQLKSLAHILSRQPFQQRVILVGPPPPPRDEDGITELVGASSKAADETWLINPAWTRLKLWHLQNEIARDYCAASKVRYLSGNLPGVQDEDGFLRPNMVKDAVHANHLYSALLLDRIAAIVSESPDHAQ